MAIILFLTPFPAFASTVTLSPKVTAISTEFSEKFCSFISNGMTLEKAGETTVAKLSKGLLFSPVMKEIMSAPKEDIATSLSNNIF